MHINQSGNNNHEIQVHRYKTVKCYKDEPVSNAYELKLAMTVSKSQRPKSKAKVKQDQTYMKSK